MENPPFQYHLGAIDILLRITQRIFSLIRAIFLYNAYVAKHRKKTEQQFLKEVNDQLKEKFHIKQTLDGVFIDAMSQSLDDIDDQDEQIAFQRETAKLWSFSQNRNLFAFKTVEDVLEENQSLKEEVGQLNEVIEIWRHGSTSAMERSRVASRSATEWRTSIAQIAELAMFFTSSIHKPLSFSPLR